jgi:cell division septum initiation protein DivIVA
MPQPQRRDSKVCSAPVIQITSINERSDWQASFTADATKVKHIGKEDFAGKGTELRKDAEAVAADAGREVDRLAQQARDGTHKVDQKLEAYRQRADQSIDQTIKKTGTELNKAVDSFDKNVGEVSPNVTTFSHGALADNKTQGAEKTKNTVSGWFGGSGK